MKACACVLFVLHYACRPLSRSRLCSYASLFGLTQNLQGKGGPSRWVGALSSMHIANLEKVNICYCVGDVPAQNASNITMNAGISILAC